jgi:hypothetical protein
MKMKRCFTKAEGPQLSSLCRCCLARHCSTWCAALVQFLSSLQPVPAFYSNSADATTGAVHDGAALVMQPLTAQSIGRRLWISYKFTNKRLIVSNT